MAGNICVVRIASIVVCLPMKRNRLRAYPPIAASATPVSVTSSDTSSELPSHRKNGCSANSWMYDWKVQSSGMIDRSVDLSRLPGRSEIDSTFSAG